MKNPLPIFMDKSSRSVSPFKIETRTFAGTNFLYVEGASKEDQKEIRVLLKEIADQIITGTQWSYELRFIRYTEKKLVFSIQFRVPNEKSFCCGNQCIDCIRFRS